MGFPGTPERLRVSAGSHQRPIISSSQVIISSSQVEDSGPQDGLREEPMAPKQRQRKSSPATTRVSP